jgi:hypothetical protein
MRAAFRNSLLAGLLLAATPALAGDAWSDWWQRHTGTDVPWYEQEPWAGTGPGLYYSNHPDHVPGYPAGHVPTYPRPNVTYAVPVFDTGRRVARRDEIGAVADHVEWCLARYRSYDVETDTYQPLIGARRLCRSPY